MQSTKILIFHHKFLISSALASTEYPPCCCGQCQGNMLGCLRCLASAQRGSGHWTLETQDKT